MSQVIVHHVWLFELHGFQEIVCRTGSACYPFLYCSCPSEIFKWLGTEPKKARSLPACIALQKIQPDCKEDKGRCCQLFITSVPFSLPPFLPQGQSRSRTALPQFTSFLFPSSRLEKTRELTAQKKEERRSCISNQSARENHLYVCQDETTHSTWSISPHAMV